MRIEILDIGKNVKMNVSYIAYVLCFLATIMYSSNVYSSSKDSIKKTQVYHVNKFVVGAITVVGMTGDYFAVKRLKDKPQISDDELTFLNSQQQRNLIYPIDRWALKQKASVSIRHRWEQMSDVAQVPIFMLPAFLLFNQDIKKDWLDLLFMYAEGHTITFTNYNYGPLGGTFIDRYRPVSYYSEIPTNTRENGSNRNSFYSGHVASCTYSTFFMAKVYCDYHPDMGFGEKCLWYIGASVPPLMMGYSRIRALDHFPSDVGIGFMVGALIGIVVPELHKNKHKNRVSLGMFSSPDGTGLSMNWKLQK